MRARAAVEMSVRPGRGDARRPARRDRPGQDPRGDHLELHCALRRSALPSGTDRPGVQPPGVAAPVSRRRNGSGRGGPVPPARNCRRQRILISKNDSTMSSETSTERARPKPDQSTLEPWQFFVLAGLGCATAALFASRGQGVTAVVLLTVLMGATALVGLAVLRTLRPLVTPEEDRTSMFGQR